MILKKTIIIDGLKAGMSLSAIAAAASCHVHYVHQVAGETGFTIPGGGKGKLKPHLAEIATLLRNNVPYQIIADKFGVTAPAVYKQAKKMKLTSHDRMASA